MLLALGCSSPPPSKLPRSNLLRYSESGMASGASFVIRQNGTVVYESTVGERTVRVDAKVTQDELDELSTALHTNACCSVASETKRAKPDEARPSYSVRMGDLDCEIVLSASDVAASPEAQACTKVLHAFGEKVASKSTSAE